MKVTPVADVLFLERFDKVQKKAANSPFITTVVSNNLGIVKYSSSDAYPVGTKVYFVGSNETITVDGAEVIVVRTENVVATLTE